MLSLTRKTIAAGTLVTACFIITAVPSARSDEPSELRQRAKSMIRKADQLSDKGQADEAQELQQAAKKLMEAASQLQKHAEQSDASAEPPQKTKKRSQQVEKPHSAERELDLRERKGTPDKHQDIQQTAEQLEHARIAVKHLQAAGLHDLAKETARRAEDGERQLREERDGGHDQRDEAIKDLRREIRQMREELQAIRSKLPGSTGSSK